MKKEVFGGLGLFIYLMMYVVHIMNHIHH